MAFSEKKVKVGLACRSLILEIAFTRLLSIFRDTETSIKVVGLDGKKLTTAEIKDIGPKINVSIEISVLQESSLLPVHLMLFSARHYPCPPLIKLQEVTG